MSKKKSQRKSKEELEDRIRAIEMVAMETGWVLIINTRTGRTAWQSPTGMIYDGAPDIYSSKVEGYGYREIDNQWLLVTGAIVTMRSIFQGFSSPVIFEVEYKEEPDSVDCIGFGRSIVFAEAHGQAIASAFDALKRERETEREQERQGRQGRHLIDGNDSNDENNGNEGGRIDGGDN